MASKRMQTAKAFIDHFTTSDLSVLQSVFADDLKYTFSPSRSLDNSSDLDKNGFIQFREMMASGLSGYPLDVIQYIESESSNSRSRPIARLSECLIVVAIHVIVCLLTAPVLVVIVWATGKPQFRKELVDYEVYPKEKWDYTGEFVFMLTMNESGEQIIKINEFVDSKGTDHTIWPLCRRLLENLEKQKQSRSE